MNAHVRGAFEAEAYDAKIRVSDEQTMKSAVISHPGLLHVPHYDKASF